MAFHSQTIGPYTLDRRLGAGGMGEVYQAYDQRLERWVAIKLIRAEAAESEKARERFRREARAAAGLSHPSIVQIFDILETGEGDAIVMELVEGESLSRRLGRGPLPVAEAVRLGREIAEGLAAAHARGIVHRDLKPDNVMIAAEGRAKILDFGLAKRLEGEASLTEDHRVIGTYRSMSPEQAKGLHLDHRSDLFSLGILLYEMLSGRSPFDGGSTLDTLTRICTHRQTPLRQLSAAVPEELSHLVDHLLEKEPARRPRTARDVVDSLQELGGVTAQRSSPASATLFEIPALTVGKQAEASHDGATAALRTRRTVIAVLAALLLLSGLIWSLAKLRRPPLLYVAVPKPTLAEGQGNAGVAILAASLRSSLLDALVALERVWPLASEQVDPVSGSSRELARATAAGEIVASQLSCNLATCQITLNRVRGTDGAVLWSRSFAAPIEQPYLVSEAVRGHLRQAYADRRQTGASQPEVRAEDYAEYMRLYESFDTRREEEYPIPVILERLARIRRSSPKFLNAYIFNAYLLQQRFRSGRDPADLARAYDVLDEARKLAPDDPRPLFSLFEVAFLGENLERAEAALRDLERLQPGDARVLAHRARLMDRRGDSKQALVFMREATERLPSWRHYFWIADMENRQGKIPEAQADLHELLRRSPDNPTGLSLLAQIELSNGDPKKAVRLYESLVRRSPQFNYLTNLGLAYFLLGDLPRAEHNFRLAWTAQPRNPYGVLNLADTCLLLKRTKEAEDLYRRTLELVAADPTAGSNWQLFSTRAQALAHLGRSGEAVAAIQEALRLAPTNPQAAYEASLVYVLLGDRVSALFNAKRALQQGIEPRWFDLPWFDPLRSTPEMRQTRAGRP